MHPANTARDVHPAVGHLTAGYQSHGSTLVDYIHHASYHETSVADATPQSQPGPDFLEQDQAKPPAYHTLYTECRLPLIARITICNTQYNL